MLFCTGNKPLTDCSAVMHYGYLKLVCKCPWRLYVYHLNYTYVSYFLSIYIYYFKFMLCLLSGLLFWICIVMFVGLCLSNHLLW